MPLLKINILDIEIYPEKVKTKKRIYDRAINFL